MALNTKTEKFHSGYRGDPPLPPLSTAGRSLRFPRTRASCTRGGRKQGARDEASPAPPARRSCRTGPSAKYYRGDVAVRPRPPVASRPVRGRPRSTTPRRDGPTEPKSVRMSKDRGARVGRSWGAVAAVAVDPRARHGVVQDRVTGRPRCVGSRSGARKTRLRPRSRGDPSPDRRPLAAVRSDGQEPSQVG